jgi:uncharacterized protein YjeT (DUF2065 family)
MNDLVTALGLVLVIEGLLYALAPEQAKRMMATVFKTPSDNLRVIGMLALASGVAVVWVAKSVFAAS